MHYAYYKIEKKHHEYHGIRFFRVSAIDDVLQCVLAHGSESRRGRTNNIGVYVISRTTFFSNYVPFGYAVPCKPKEFYDACWKVLKTFFPAQTDKFIKRKNR